MNAERTLSVDDDYLVNLHIPAKLLEFDLGLFQTKWFDYRRMTPLEATVEYTRRYAEVYRTIYARELDFKRAQHVRTVNPILLLTELENNDKDAKRKMTALWRGRQVADAIGMPYALYIELAFTYRMRNWKQPYLPQPQHLYGEWDVERVQDRWQELQASSLYIPEDPAYLVQNYQDLAYQNDFHEWCFKQASLRPSSHDSILARLIQENKLPIDKVAARFDADIYQRIERELENPSF